MSPINHFIEIIKVINHLIEPWSIFVGTDNPTESLSRPQRRTPTTIRTVASTTTFDIFSIDGRTVEGRCHRKSLGSPSQRKYCITESPRNKDFSKLNFSV